jgi:hypothetical protein
MTRIKFAGISTARVDEIIAEVQEADRERRQIEAKQNEQANAKLKWLFDQLNLGRPLSVRR